MDASIGSAAPAPKISAVRMAFLIVTCALIMVLEGFDIQALGIAAPVLMPLLKLDPVQSGQIFSAAQAGVVLGALAGGFLSDKWGRRNVLLLAVLIFGAFNLSTAFVHDFTTLLWARALTGFGLGAAMPNVIGLAVEYASPKNRVKAVTAIMAGMPLGGASAALFARLYFKDMGWQSLFYIGGIIPIVLILLIVFLPNARTARVEDNALQTGRKTGLWSALFGGGRAVSTLLLWVVFFLTSSVLYMILNWLPSLMTQRGMDVQVGQMASLVFNLVSIAGTLTLGAVIDRFGYKWAMPLAYLGFLAGMCGMALTGAAEALMISVGVTGFFLLGAQYSLNGISPMYYPKPARGLGTGAAIAFGRIGSITGPLMAGYILKTGIGPLHGPSGVALAMIPLIIVAGFAVTLLVLNAKILED
jgi:MFS transporter, AAHS family, 3-hydroxyphenylpropionic acid transporter